MANRTKGERSIEALEIQELRREVEALRGRVVEVEDLLAKTWDAAAAAHGHKDWTDRRVPAAEASPA